MGIVTENTSKKGSWFYFIFMGLLIFALTGWASKSLAVEWVWTDTYGGPDNGWDTGRGVAVSPKDGSVYVTGATYVTGQGRNIWLSKYSPGGEILWTETHNGYDNDDDEGRGVAVSPNGRAVYVTGSTYVDYEEENIWLSKYSPGGQKRWTRTFNGRDDGPDMGHGVAVSPNGRAVYVIGETYVDGQEENIWLRKYSSRGRKRWTRTKNGDGNEMDIGYGVAVSPKDGSVYVTGVTRWENEYGFLNAWVCKYSSSGDKINSRLGLVHPHGDGVGFGIAVAPNGRAVYVTGWNTIEGESDNIIILKYSPDLLDLRWKDVFDGYASDWDHGYGVAVSPNSRAVYVTGGTTELTGLPPDPDKFTWVRKYSFRGKERWTETYNGPMDWDTGRDIAVSPNGKAVYVTGGTDVPGEDENIWVRKLR